LLHLHLQKLEEAGGHQPAGAVGRRQGAEFFEAAPFAIDLTPAMIAEAIKTLTNNPENRGVLCLNRFTC
jgi:acetaldehyde dehydrogenase (acetylating)